MYIYYIEYVLTAIDFPLCEVVSFVCIPGLVTCFHENCTSLTITYKSKTANAEADFGVLPAIN